VFTLNKQHYDTDFSLNSHPFTQIHKPMCSKFVCIRLQLEHFSYDLCNYVYYSFLSIYLFPFPRGFLTNQRKIHNDELTSMLFYMINRSQVPAASSQVYSASLTTKTVKTVLQNGRNTVLLNVCAYTMTLH